MTAADWLRGVVLRALGWGSPSVSTNAVKAGEVFVAGLAAGIVAPPGPPLTAAELEELRRRPPAPVPDWYDRSPLAQKARMRRKRRREARGRQQQA